MPLRILVDECLSPELVAVANAWGLEAYHVAHRGWQSRDDAFLRSQILEHDFTLVTNNWSDFEPMLRHAGLHAGAIVLPNVPREEQVRLFELALRAAATLAEPPDLTNLVIVVNREGRVDVHDLPDRES